MLLETGGHRSVAQVPSGVVRIIDVKCPASGEAREERLVESRPADATDEVKFVVQDRQDYEFAKDVITRHALAGRCAAILISPVHGVLPGKDLAAWILADRLPVRLQLQAHKYIWSADTRGV